MWTLPKNKIENGSATRSILTMWPKPCSRCSPFPRLRDGLRKNAFVPVLITTRVCSSIKHFQTVAQIDRLQRRGKGSDSQLQTDRGCVLHNIYNYNSVFHGQHIRRFRYSDVSKRRRTGVQELRTR